MVADHMLNLIQQFYTEERIIMIAKPDDMGETTREPMKINERTPAGEILNNITMGEYDVVATAIPHAASFQSTQFRELLEMKKIGVNIPDTALVQVSSVAKKQELIAQMNNTDPEIAQIQKETAKAELEQLLAGGKLKLAQAEKAKSAAVVDGVAAAFSSVQSAQVMASVAGLVPVADEILLSAGFVDKNAAPVFMQPTTLGAPAPPVSDNTSPMFPAKPVGATEGLNAGMETLRAD
jgi:hypothetical protein